MRLRAVEPDALLRQLREDLIGQQAEHLGDDRLIRRGVVCPDKPFDWAGSRVPRIELVSHSNIVRVLPAQIRIVCVSSTVYSETGRSVAGPILQTFATGTSLRTTQLDYTDAGLGSVWIPSQNGSDRQD